MSVLIPNEMNFRFVFFVDERIPELRHLIDEVYREIYSDHFLNQTLPPSFGMIVQQLEIYEVYSTELLWRAWYKGDVYHCGHNVQELLQEGWKEAQASGAFDTLVQYFEHYIEKLYEDWGEHIFRVDSEDVYGWGKKFLNDVDTLLRLSSMFYIDVKYDDEDAYTYNENGPLPNTWQLKLHNCPIIEVW